MEGEHKNWKHRNTPGLPRTIWKQKPLNEPNDLCHSPSSTALLQVTHKLDWHPSPLGCQCGWPRILRSRRRRSGGACGFVRMAATLHQTGRSRWVTLCGSWPGLYQSLEWKHAAISPPHSRSQANIFWSILRVSPVRKGILENAFPA